jgi:uncharacterized protein (TIGR02453 family)
VAKKQVHFSDALFAFLSELKENNDKEWFAANKARYEADVREPMLAFIGDFADPLEKISPHFVADPRKQGGSMFRIHRDVRFSKDKSPYKTMCSAHFRHEATSKDVHGPGFYLHLEPGRVFVGAGIYMPPGPTLTAIREAIVADPARWKKAINGRSFKAGFSLGGESLKRPPRGFDPDHELIDDLKRKSFIAVADLSEEDVTAAGFIDQVAKLYKAGGPLMAFLASALDLPY